MNKQKSKQKLKDWQKEGCKQIEPNDVVGNPEEIAKAVHEKLDWVRACKKRGDDNRAFDVEAILVQCQKGFELTKNFPSHYLGD